MLKPGNYRLSRDVTNPHPDRRVKRDWRDFVVWKKGWEFMVTDDRNRLSPEDTGGVTIEWTLIQLVGGRYGKSLSMTWEDKYRALEAALEPVDESLEAMFAKLDIEDGFTRWLAKSGRLDRATLEALWADYMAHDSDSDDDPNPGQVKLEIVGSGELAKQA